MQVKKFEAKTIKEALEMVKRQMGPDAIILSAKDNSQRFGLVGESTVEVTAAISEKTLQKKRYVESKMTEKRKEQFQSSPASVQKQIIERSIEGEQMTFPAATARHRASIPYVDIQDEPNELERRTSSDNLREHLEQRISRSEVAQQRGAQREVVSDQSSQTISGLRSEVAQLKSILSQIQNEKRPTQGFYPGADFGIPFPLSFAFQHLRNSGLTDLIASEIVRAIQNEIPENRLSNKPLVFSFIAKHLLNEIMLVEHPFFKKIHCFVGTNAQGKTLTLVKIASHLVLNLKKSVLIISVDNSKIGAREQLKTYAQLLNASFVALENIDEWADVVQEINRVDYVLVDFPGSSLVHVNEIESMKQLLPPFPNQMTVHHVASLAGKDADIQRMAEKYLRIGIDDLIFTFLDQTQQYGTIFNVQQRLGLPVHSFGVGPKVPEDFELATKERIVDLILNVEKITQTEMKERNSHGVTS